MEAKSGGLCRVVNYQSVTQRCTSIHKPLGKDWETYWFQAFRIISFHLLAYHEANFAVILMAKHDKENRYYLISSRGSLNKQTNNNKFWVWFPELLYCIILYVCFSMKNFWNMQRSIELSSLHGKKNQSGETNCPL